jgi:hypothetical protein
MAFEKFITTEQKLKTLGEKLDKVISDLDAMLLKEDLLVTPVFGEAIQDTPPQDAPIDPFDTPQEPFNDPT